MGANRPVVVDTTHSPHALLRPVAVDAVRLDDAFWAPRRRAIAETAIPAQFEQLEVSGRFDNFRRAAGTQSGPHQGYYFNDSDVYKWLEAASWALAGDAYPALEQLIERTIDEIAAAQQEDGYLDTFYQLGMGTGRWTELTRTHELYCAGHLMQGAIAHQRVTGSSRLMQIATRFAGLICDTLGPAEQGKQPGTDGHEEAEMALVELARQTGEQRYFEQARYFLDARGHGLAGGDEYHQDHQPFRELARMTGHAVRAVYLNAGAADIYAETGEPALLEALERLWHDMTTRRMYVNGAIGSRYEQESFGADYELPNARAYAETCAAIGSVMWNWRMLLISGQARYADLLETTLFNAVLPGIALDARHYFYENPLSNDGSHRRQPWFECACCPPNFARLIASVPGYLYAVSDNAVWVNLYAQSEADLHLPDGRSVRLRQHTRYPWDGDIELTVDVEGPFALHLRIPAWCESGAQVDVNGERHATTPQPGSYARIERDWRPGDRVRLHLPMPARLLEAHPYAIENTGRVAIQRGPIVYCFEQPDNPGIDPRDVVLPAAAEFAVEHRPDLLGGVSVLQADVQLLPPDAGWTERLYRPHGAGSAFEPPQPARVTLVPYFAWANREPGRMEVWLQVGKDAR